jgi:hypothetical protein
MISECILGLHWKFQINLGNGSCTISVDSMFILQSCYRFLNYEGSKHILWAGNGGCLKDWFGCCRKANYLSTQCLYYTWALNAYTFEGVLGEGDPPPPDPLPLAATQVGVAGLLT